MMRFGAALFAALLLALPAAAHTKSETHANWRIDGDTVHLTFTVPQVEAERLRERAGTAPLADTVLAYLNERISVTQGEAGCDRAASSPAGATSGFQRFEFTFRCSGQGGVVLRSSAFFDLVPTHVTFAQIATGDGSFVEQLFTSERQSLAVGESDEEAALRDAGFFEYVRLGILHILTGADHMSFLLGLVLLSRHWRDLAFVVTGFTLGHSATLALAVTGVLRPHAEYIDALVGLTIALVGAENVVLASGRTRIVALSAGGLLLAFGLLRVAGVGLLPPLLLFGAALFTTSYLMVSGKLHDAGRVRLLVTLVFGLIHGFGFASDLIEMRLPAERLAELLVGFNLGVEVGQLSFVFLLVALAALLTRARLAPSRALTVDLTSAGLVAFGVLLFATRSIG